MSVAGLPTAVKAMLEALLAENQLTSWKVASEGSKTVVVFRMTSSSTAAITAHSTSKQQFRRKPPSQLRRDAMRAEAYTRSKQQEQQQEQQASPLFRPTPLFSPTPEKESVGKDDRCDTQYEQASIPSLSPLHHYGNSARENRELDIAERATDFETGSLADMHACYVNKNTDLVEESAVDSEMSEGKGKALRKGDSETEEERVIENSAEQAGFLLDDIYEQVGAVTNTKKQRRLRDIRRNQSIHHAVLDKRFEQNVLVCESDDIVLRYDIRERKVTDWYIKMRDSSARCLKRSKPLSKDDFAEDRRQATRDLNVLAAAVRLYLG